MREKEKEKSLHADQVMLAASLVTNGAPPEVALERIESALARYQGRLYFDHDEALTLLRILSGDEPPEIEPWVNEGGNRDR